MIEWMRTFWYVLTLRCDEAERLRCAPDPELLHRHEVVAERIHRLLCKSCRRAKEQLETMSRVLGSLRDDSGLDNEAGLSADAQQRIIRAMEEAGDSQDGRDGY